MPRRPRIYSPALDRIIVSALYHEARRQNKPMTRLANTILAAALKGTPGWHQAEQHGTPQTPPNR